MEIRRRNAAATEVCNFGGNGKPWGNVATSSSAEIFESCSTRSSWSTWDRWESLLVQWFKRNQRSHIQIKILDTSHKEVDLTLGNDITTTSSESKRKHITKPFNRTSPISICYPSASWPRRNHCLAPIPSCNSACEVSHRTINPLDLHQGYPGVVCNVCNGSIKVEKKPHYLCLRPDDFDGCRLDYHEVCWISLLGSKPGNLWPLNFRIPPPDLFVFSLPVTEIRRKAPIIASDWPKNNVWWSSGLISIFWYFWGFGNYQFLTMKMILFECLTSNFHNFEDAFQIRRSRMNCWCSLCRRRTKWPRWRGG